MRNARFAAVVAVLGLAIAFPAAAASCKDNLDAFNKRVAIEHDRDKRKAAQTYASAAEKDMKNSEVACQSNVVRGWKVLRAEPEKPKPLANVDTPFTNVKKPYHYPGMPPTTQYPGAATSKQENAQANSWWLYR